MRNERAGVIPFVLTGDEPNSLRAVFLNRDVFDFFIVLRSREGVSVSLAG
jgi:hypothetical protein